MFDPTVFDAFCRGYDEEMRRIRQEHAGTLASAGREIDKLNRRSNQIKELLLSGFSDDLWKQELRDMRSRRELGRLLAAADYVGRGPQAHVRRAMAVESPDDGLTFLPDSVRVDPIREDQEYGGMRVKLLAMLGNVRIPLRGESHRVSGANCDGTHPAPSPRPPLHQALQVEHLSPRDRPVLARVRRLL